VQSPSWEAKNSFASQEIPPILWNTNVHYYGHKNPCHLFASWARSIHSMSPQLIPERSILILSSHLTPGIPSGLFPSGCSTKILYAPILDPTCATCPAYLIPLYLIIWMIFGKECKSRSPSLCSLLQCPVA